MFERSRLQIKPDLSISILFVCGTHEKSDGNRKHESWVEEMGGDGPTNARTESTESESWVARVIPQLSTL